MPMKTCACVLFCVFAPMIDQRNADHHVAHDHIPTAAGARTAHFAPDFEALFVAVPQRGNQDAEICCYKAE